MIADEFSGQWKTIECDNISNNIRFPYICKKLSTNTTTATTTAFPTQSGVNYGCDNGWSNWNTNCYRYYNSLSDHKSFDDAKQACKANKSELVEVFSEEENQFLVSLLQTREFKARLKSRASLGCPSGWNFSNIENTCYQVISISTNDWNKAQSYCKKQGGNLVSIKSASELSFVSRLGKNKFFSF